MAAKAVRSRYIASLRPHAIICIRLSSSPWTAVTGSGTAAASVDARCLPTKAQNHHRFEDEEGAGEGAGGVGLAVSSGVGGVGGTSEARASATGWDACCRLCAGSGAGSGTGTGNGDGAGGVGRVGGESAAPASGAGSDTSSRIRTGSETGSGAGACGRFCAGCSTTGAKAGGSPIGSATGTGASVPTGSKLGTPPSSPSNSCCWNAWNASCVSRIVPYGAQSTTSYSTRSSSAGPNPLPTRLLARYCRTSEWRE